MNALKTPAFSLPLATALALIIACQAKSETYKLTKLDKEYLARAQHMERDFDKRGLVIVDKEVNAYLDLIAGRLEESVSFEPHVDLRVKLFRHPVENAFALGNGSIYVSLGLVSRMEDEDQLAAVLAHELSHVMLNHPFQGYKDYVASATISNIAVIITGLPAESNALFYLAINGYSRKLEREADLKALALLADSDYDPGAMIRALSLLDVNYDGEAEDEPDIFWRDHPTTEKRKEYLQEAINQTYSDRGSFPQHQDRDAYYQKTASIRHQTCALNIDHERFGTALAIIERSLKHCPEDPEILVDLGMTKRAWADWSVKEKVRFEEKNNGRKCHPNPCPDSEKSEEEEIPLLLEKAPDFEEAEQYLIKAVTIDPSLAIAHFELGELYAATGQINKALVNYNRYLSLEPKGKYWFKAKAKIKKLQSESSVGPGSSGEEKDRSGKKEHGKDEP
jgi:predicted Zn-dependent protease